MTDQCAGHEIAGHENAGHELTGHAKAKQTRSSAIAGRPCDAKACQGLQKWTWK